MREETKSKLLEAKAYIDKALANGENALTRHIKIKMAVSALVRAEQALQESLLKDLVT